MTELFRRGRASDHIPVASHIEHHQVAALCYRQQAGGTEVLLITSRGTGRWIIPKGWPMEGKSGAEAALQEAWEEAGVREAIITPEPLGFFDYLKQRRKKPSIEIRATTYLAEVKALSPVYPEAHERERAWFSVEEAAALVGEPELKAILRAL